MSVIPHESSYYFIEVWKDREHKVIEKYYSTDQCFKRLQELINDDIEFCVYEAECVLDAT